MDPFKKTMLTRKRIKEIIDQNFTPTQTKQSIDEMIQYSAKHNISYELWQLYEALALYGMLVEDIGDSQKAQVVRDHLLATVNPTIENPWFWINRELRFEIWAIGYECRIKVAKAVLKSFDSDEINDEMLDNYNERIHRFSNNVSQD